MERLRTELIVTIMAWAAFAAGLSAAAATPAVVVEKSNDKVLAIYASSEKIDVKTESEIYRIIDEVTDYEGIAAAVTSRFCDNLTEEQCRQFKEVFIRLLRISSIKKLGRYRADSFDYLEEEIDGDTAVVRTVANFKDEKIALDYVLESRDGLWLIVNYVVDDVDTIRNYRKQFKRLFARKSYEQVIERLEERIASYEQEDSP